MKPLRLWLVYLLALLPGVLSPAMASTGQQPSTTVITMTAPEYLSSLYRNTIIPAFEAENPDIRVEFVFTEQNYYGNPTSADAEQQAEYFENLAAYAASADVLYVSNYFLNPYATATGFFLDLAPLVNTDSALQAQDFYPAAWQAFQWDGSMWALPYAVSLEVLIYNKTMFDEAGMNYPDENWQIADFVNAAEALHTFDSQGRVELSPLVSLNPGLLMTPIVGNFYDEGTIPNQPDYTHPALAEALAVWIDYYQRHEMAPLMVYSFNELPMSISFPYQMAQNSFMEEDNTDWDVVLPPGGRAFTQSEGFAISRGSSNPEAAYRFLAFLTQSPDLLANSFGGYPARRSLADAEPSEDLFVSRPEFEPEVQAFLDDALENAIPTSELRFSDVFYQARAEVEENGVEIATALETVQERAISALEEAQTYQSRQIVVEAPVLREVAPDEVVLNFGLNMSGSSSASRQQWADLVDEFSSTNSIVGDVVINDQIYGPDGLDTSLDCFYDGFSQLGFSQTPPEQFLALDPLINADASFDPNDFWPGVLDQAQVGGGTYGYPIIIQPLMMWVNTDKLLEAGLTIPEGTWTVNDFGAAIEAFKGLRSDPETPIITIPFQSASVYMMLMASYGGILIDYRTTPFSYNLTDPQTVTALEQLAQFVRDGVLDYQSQINRGSGSTAFLSSLEDRFISIDLGHMMRFGMTPTNVPNPMQPVMFPVGEYAPMAYQVGMTYINSQSANIEACYEWITTVAEHPELLNGMPARRSTLDNTALIAAQGAPVVDFYRVFGESLDAPNALHFPSPYGVGGVSIGSSVELILIYFSLDRILMDDANVITEMEQAGENIDAFRQCTADIEELSVDELQILFEEDENAGIRHYLQYVDCAVAIIPEVRGIFSFYYDDLSDQ